MFPELHHCCNLLGISLVSLDRCILFLSRSGEEIDIVKLASELASGRNTWNQLCPGPRIK